MEDTSNITNVIIQTINSIFQTLFSSLDNSIYSVLDDITFIDTNILHSSIFQRIFGNGNYSGILLIANSLLLGFSIYYAIRLLYSHYMNIQIERPYQFVFKLLIFGIAMNYSYFICEQIIQINSLVSDAIRSVGFNIYGHSISFAELITKINSTISVGQNDFSIFSFDGMIKGFVSISLFSLVFSYSLRYIMIKVFIILTPFFILSLVNSSTSWLFKTWLRTFLSLLLQQSFISIILLIIFTFNFSSPDIINKLMCIGGIYALNKANEYIRSIVGGISTDVSSNFNIASTFLKK